MGSAFDLVGRDDLRNAPEYIPVPNGANLSQSRTSVPLVFPGRTATGTVALPSQNRLNSVPFIPVPDYAFDCHTRKGKASGATKVQFFSAEHAALQPFQPGLFDHLVNG